MRYFKIKVKAFNSRSEAWIAFHAASISGALRKATEHCNATQNIFYPMEEFLVEISEEEYQCILSSKTSR